MSRHRARGYSAHPAEGGIRLITCELHYSSYRSQGCGQGTRCACRTRFSPLEIETRLQYKTHVVIKSCAPCIRMRVSTRTRAQMNMSICIYTCMPQYPHGP